MLIYNIYPEYDGEKHGIKIPNHKPGVVAFCSSSSSGYVEAKMYIDSFLILQSTLNQ